MAFCHRWHLCQTRWRWASTTRGQGPRCRPSHAWVRSHISGVYPSPSADRFGPACWKSPDGGLQTAGRHQRPNRAASRVAGSAMVWMTLSRCMFRSTPGGGFRMRFTAASGWFPDQSPRTTLGSWARSVPAGRNMRHRGPRWDPAATRTNPHGSWLSACRGHPAIASPQAASNPTSHPDLSHGGERNVLENAFGLVEFQERIP
jgi:hypothetical protein